MDGELLTEDEAYCAMYAFLADYYRITKEPYLGGLLGSLSLLENGMPADPAVQTEWKSAISKARQGQVDVRLRLADGESLGGNK